MSDGQIGTHSPPAASGFSARRVVLRGWHEAGPNVILLMWEGTGILRGGGISSGFGKRRCCLVPCIPGISWGSTGLSVFWGFLGADSHIGWHLQDLVLCSFGQIIFPLWLSVSPFLSERVGL